MARSCTLKNCKHIYKQERNTFSVDAKGATPSMNMEFILHGKTLAVVKKRSQVNVRLPQISVKDQQNSHILVINYDIARIKQYLLKI